VLTDRELCAKLFLRAESQEIDRIIEAFSARFYQCNPDTVFGSPGVVHTVTGAMLMLNTDLHIADLTKHMSRTDFIRNAMSAIRESLPEEDAENGDGPLLPPQAAALRPHNAQRSASAPVVHPGHPNAIMRVVSEAGALAGPGSSSSLETHTYSRAWEAEAEAALRDIYNAVRSERILLPISNSNRQSMVSLATSLDSRKPRTPSGAHKRQSVIGRPGGALNSVYADNRSPTGSYATSINEVRSYISCRAHANL
jgi:PH/SEC7 domain-containing protein